MPPPCRHPGDELASSGQEAVVSGQRPSGTDLVSLAANIAGLADDRPTVVDAGGTTDAPYGAMRAGVPHRSTSPFCRRAALQPDEAWVRPDES